MEPAAPGTEDDIPVLPANFKKQENEQERLLSIRAKLPNGRFGNVFEHSIVNGSELWYCNLCGCPVMGRIYHHEVGKRHTTNMQASGGYSENTEADADADPEPPLFIAPGEPVPPGFEDNVEKVARIQERFDNFKNEALIGLEYLFELTDIDIEKEPSYLCTLCDKRGDPRTVIAHLASYNHVSQYLQRHFLKCYRALSPYITKQYKRNWQITMQKIAEAIEAKYGRLKPHVVDKALFEKKRTAYQAMVVKGPHFTERPGLTFEEMVIKDELTKVIEEDTAAIKQAEEAVRRIYDKTGTETTAATKRSPSPPVVAKPIKPKSAPIGSVEKRRSLSSVSSISSSDLSDFDPGQPVQKTANKSNDKFPKSNVKENRNKPPPFKRQRYSPPHVVKRYESPPKNRNDNRFDKKQSVLPWQRPDYRSRDENPILDRPKPKIDKNEEFKKLATAIEKDMDRILKQHEKNPEKHPQYSEEWKKFWNRRYKELQSEGKNPAGHDFKPEWIEYWNKRLKEIHANEVKIKKDALRKRLGLPEEPAPICFKITGKKKPNHKEDAKLAPMASTPDHDPDVIIIDDKDSSEDHILKRSRSPWESETVRGSHLSRIDTMHRDSHSRNDSLPRHDSRLRNSSRSRNNSRPRSESRSSSRSRSRSRIHRSRSRELENRSRDLDTRSRELENRSRELDWQTRDLYREYPREKMYYRSEYPHEYLKLPRVMRDVTRHPVSSPPRHIPPEPEPEPVDDGEINIVSVLRLLTALEEKLGSLGPKIIDLLSQALAMEKAEANSSETLLDNDINCVMFETVKEKLKGQLLAGLVNYAQEKAFKTAIKKIASLIHYAGERKKEREKEKPKIDPIKVPGVGTVDKAAIAKQIAAALIVQGKTDVTQAELEQLINAVVGMAEASQASNKPMTTASFLQQLTTAKQAGPADKTEPPATTNKTVVEPTSSVNTNNMEGLSDSDLKTLLQNFKDLCTDEQHSLISYLKKLEAREPERVERLRKFVKLEAHSVAPEKDETFEKSDEEGNDRVSPFANRFARTNPTNEENLRNKFDNNGKTKVLEKITIDSDDEDYSIEDVFKAANKNLRDKEEKDEQERLLAQSASIVKNEQFDLANAKSIIANIMGQIKNQTEMAPAVNVPVVNAPAQLPVGVVPPPKPPSVPLFASFPNPNIFDNINLANLSSAINTAQLIKQNPPQVPIQPPITNPNNFSLQPHLNPTQPNVNPNAFALPSGSQSNLMYPTRQPFPVQQQQQQFAAPNTFEPTQHNQIRGRFPDNNPHRGNFNAPVQPNQMGRRPDCYDRYGNRW